MSEIRVGMSGWTFAPWRGHFYPKKMVQKKELEYASRQVNSIEINGTFYSLQKPKTFQSWYDQTPEDFVFAVKAPQFITHVLRLKDSFEPLCTFLGSGLLCLKKKLGPILWQFPPNVTLKDDRFEKFIKLLPQDSNHAAELSKNHSSKIEGRAWTEAGGDYRIRHAFEFRHSSFQNRDFIEMMKAYSIAVVIADSAKKSPYFEDLTSDFVYVRMQGENLDFEKGYTDLALKEMAYRVKTWSSGSQVKDAKCVSDLSPFPGEKDIFLYFNNDEKINSPHDAVKMIKLLKIKMAQESNVSAA
jgi:uncharacterized protein YecE (DUF72 family)